MIFNGIALLLVLIMTSYLASQGTLTALMGLISAAFASLVAMGYFEFFQGYLFGWKPDYARGISFLGLFLIAYLIFKLAGDTLVPKNIRLPKGVDRGVGAVIGFFAGMLAVGTTVLGVEMLPLHSNILGYDRFEGENRMQGSVPGVAAEGKNVWLSPEGLTMGFWNMASGRALGGAHPFAAVHPNLADEAWGVRNVVQYGQMETLPKGLNVTAAYFVEPTDTAQAERLHLSPGKRGYVARCEITGGGDLDAYFRVTPTAVRLVTDKNKQYFPIGYLEKGLTFESTPLANGNVADDENAGAAVEEWVFQFDPGETPMWLEIKALSRADLTAVPTTPKPFVQLAKDRYPKKDYKANEGTVVITVASSGSPIANAKVLFLRGSPTRRDLDILGESYNRSKDVLQQFTDGGGGWHDPPQNNEHFPKETFQNSQRMMREPAGSALDVSVSLRDQLPHMYVAHTTSSPLSTPGILESWTNGTVIPAFEKGTNIVINQGVTDGSGKVTFEHCPKGTWVAFSAVKIDTKFFMWCANVEVKPKETTNRALETGKADFKFPPSF